MMPFVVQVPYVSVAPASAASVAQGWGAASRVTLTQDLQYRRGDRHEHTDVYIEADVAWIYVAFVCVQNVPIIAEQ